MKTAFVSTDMAAASAEVRPWPVVELESDAAVREAMVCDLHENGFCIVRLPDAAYEEIAQLRLHAAAFFAQSDADKRRVGQDAEGCWAEGVGYRSREQDASEFLELFLDRVDATTVPRIPAPHEGLWEASALLHRRLSNVARTLLAALASHLRLPAATLLDPLALYEGGRALADADDEAMSSSLLRVCFYQESAAGDAVDEERKTVFAPHTDSTLITLSPVWPASPGLQLKRPGNTWLDVEALPGLSPLDVEVHAGDFLDILSRGYFAAASHRVVQPQGGGARVSCPLLLRPQLAWRSDRGWLQVMMQDDEDSEREDCGEQ